MSLNQPNFATLLERGVVEIFPNNESENLRDRLQKRDRPLRIKLGIRLKSAIPQDAPKQDLASPLKKLPIMPKPI